MIHDMYHLQPTDLIGSLMIGNAGFKTEEAAKICGLDSRMVTYYSERLKIVPEIDAGEGRGKVKRYSKKNLFEFCIIKELHGYGIAFKNIKELFKPFIEPIPERYDNKGRIKSLNMKGYSGSWSEIPDESFFVIYKKGSGRLLPEICQMPVRWVLDKHKLKASTSVIMINLGLIVNKIKAL